jgi:hypothetical protein
MHNYERRSRMRPSASRILLNNPHLSSKSTWEDKKRISEGCGSLNTALRSSIVQNIYTIDLRDPDGSQAEDMDLISEVKILARRYLTSEAEKRSRNTSMMIGNLLGAVHVLQDHVDTLGARFNKPSNIPSKTPSQPPHYKTLYRICCHQPLHCHDQTVYEDEPHYDGNMIWGNDEVLRGDHPVFNIETYLKQQLGLHFVIVREYDCVLSRRAGFEDAGQLDVKTRVRRGREKLWIISPVLHTVLEDMSQCKLSTEESSMTNLVQLDAPYNILFHHHRELLALAGRDRLRGPVLNGLLSYVGTNYESDYEDARLMFMNGFVCSAHLGKLFRPGQMVVASDAQTGAFRVSIIIECVALAYGNVKLKGWCWTFDGVRLIRALWSGDIAIPSQEPTPINQLAVFPTEYAPDEIMGIISKRGKKFWEIRDRAHLGYTGWDALRQHQYVC